MFLYFVEEMLFLLFGKRKATYLNAPWPTVGCISYYFLTYDNVQNVSCSYAGECLYTVLLKMLMHKIHITVVLYNCKSIRSVVWPKLYDALHEEPSGANMYGVFFRSTGNAMQFVFGKM